MDWHSVRNKRSSDSGILGFQSYPSHPTAQSYPVGAYFTESDGSFYTYGPNNCRTSYFESQYPIYCADWRSSGSRELVALVSFRKGYQNKIQIVHGVEYHHKNSSDPDDRTPPTAGADSDDSAEASSCAFNFSLAAEVPVDYPITHTQWDPLGFPRIAASLEVLRLYQFCSETLLESELVQTHLLANNSTGHGGSTDQYDINTLPPVTSFDWNKTDPSIIITLSVDTTCTVWDLNRSSSVEKHKNEAQVKTQLIAHDSEVFDVKFLHKSTNVFASVSNDGSMRVFDLRSLEHSTIIYEPILAVSADATVNVAPGHSYNSQALLRLLASNVDQHHLATVGVNLNHVLIIDMRMPGVPVATLDALFGGMNHTAVNLIAWNPLSNVLLTGGDDCQALVWDFTRGLSRSLQSAVSVNGSIVIDTPDLAFPEDLEVNNVCWREGTQTHWMGVASGKGFQAVQAW
ncbi:WD40 repeat-like protein [Metschnikowia bicuspidata]|uniref:WD40 repeat-like protein n=1 Tax=Metschnikowia bicuspidata TaxID=27322 RepID=A0A4P9ZB79_9ASCO|nr:WD40 repeat-like protein [Metschnikowia bicuspidata]